ncbi:MAG: O-antigen ligase family protein [Acidobacteriota bacterium]
MNSTYSLGSAESPSGPARSREDGEFTRRSRRFWVVIGTSIYLAVTFPYPITKYVLGAILGFLYLSVLRTEMALALCFLVFAAPILDLTPRSLAIVPGLNLTSIVIGLLVIAWFHYQERNRAALAALPRQPLAMPMGFFVASCMVAILQSAWFEKMSLYYLLQLFKDQFIGMILLLVAYKVLRTAGERAAVFKMVLVMDVLLACYSVYDYGAGVRKRSPGLIGGQPNLYGGFLAMQLPLFLALAMTPGVKRRTKGLAVAGVIVLTQALLLTGSRGAWVGAAASFLVVGMFAYRRAILVLAALSLLIPSMMYGVSQSRFEMLVNPITKDEELDRSSTYRIEVWKHLPRMIDPPYIWGHGYAMAPIMTMRSGLRGHRKSTHSSIITMIVQQGLVGLFLYLWILFRLFRRARRCFLKTGNPWGKALAAGYMGTVFALLVCDVTGERFHAGEIMTYVWVLGGTMLREEAGVAKDLSLSGEG